MSQETGFLRKQETHMNIEKSIELFAEAKNLLPGGVDSPVRAFRAVGGQPIFFDSGQGPILTDVDGNRYIDLILGMTCIIGHNHPKVAQAVQEQIPKGLVSFQPDVGRDVLAEMMCKRVPSVDKVWFTLGGSQSFMWTIRAARGFTGGTKS